MGTLQYSLHRLRLPTYDLILFWGILKSLIARILLNIRTSTAVLNHLPNCIRFEILMQIFRSVCITWTFLLRNPIWRVFLWPALLFWNSKLILSIVFYLYIKKITIRWHLCVIIKLRLYFKIDFLPIWRYFLFLVSLNGFFIILNQVIQRMFLLHLLTIAISRPLTHNRTRD